MLDPLAIIDAKIEEIERHLAKRCCAARERALLAQRGRLEALRAIHTSVDDERIGATLVRYLGGVRR